MDSVQTLDLFLRGVAVGAQGGLGIALARSAANASLRIATVLFIVANTAFILLGSAAMRAQMSGTALTTLWFVQVGGAGYLWMFSTALFEDRPFVWRSLMPAALLTAVALVARYVWPQYGPVLWGLHNLLGLGIAAHAALVIARSGAADLVEERRRLRVPLLLIFVGYSMLLSVAQIVLLASGKAAWAEPTNAAIQALLGIAGIVRLLEARAALFGSAERVQRATVNDDEIEAAWLARLRTVMEADEVWRQEGLTVAELGTRVGLPEHRLRRLINDRLGHRNFAAFVNQHRVAAARTVLADPAQANRAIATIAFDLGFGSLGPFNRAFREETGIAPTEYRRAALAGGAPISENPR